MAVTRKKTRVLIVDDSAVARRYLIDGLSEKPNIEVVGYAINAADARKKVEQLRPDVLTLDVELPDMNGIELLKSLLPVHRIPVILVSSLNLRVFDALAAGAVDFVRKPDGTQKKEEFLTTLTQKIIIAAIAKVRTLQPEKLSQPEDAVRSSKPLRDDDRPLLRITKPAQTNEQPPLLGPSPELDRMVIGLGASTGGTEATLEILRRLPADIPGMVIVQHMPPGFTKMYAERLDRICAMEVREAVDGDTVHRGLALVAPADLQCTFVRYGNGYRVACRMGEKVSGHRPSVDALFSSMAETVHDGMTRIILTGMGRDGASGLLAMRGAGAYTIGQDRASSVVYGMPMVAYDIGAVQVQAPCEKIAAVLLKHLQAHK